MNIRMILKSYDMKMSEFASVLFLSRPTLNKYIALYEEKEKLSDPKYQILFDRLFKEASTKAEFYKTLENCNGLLAKDIILDTTKLSPRKTDIVSLIVEEMKKDLEKDDSEERVYQLILMIISNYNNVTIFKDMANYFLTLNSIINYNILSLEEKNKVLKFFGFFKSINEDIDYKLIEKKFIKRIDEIKRQQEGKEKQKKDELNTLINDEIKKQISAGKSIDSIDVEEILQKLITKE